MSKIAKLCEIFHSHLSFFVENLLIPRFLTGKITLFVPKLFRKILISNTKKVLSKDQYQSPVNTYVYIKD